MMCEITPTEPLPLQAFERAHLPFTYPALVTGLAPDLGSPTGLAGPARQLGPALRAFIHIGRWVRGENQDPTRIVFYNE